MKRIFAGLLAVPMGLVPVALPVGWAPLLASGVAALLAAYAALGPDR